eukprot:XP_011453859.1 PREDICTED: uncharacterized protein LOC105346835 [Crassostrea gigas]
MRSATIWIFVLMALGPSLMVLSSAGLTREEIVQFKATGKYGASVAVYESDSAVFYISASGLPDHETEKVNPNTATAKNYNLSIPKTPEIVPVPGCVGLGMIGITRTGVAIYNPLAGDLSNAVEGASPEVFDKCDGHASPDGAYHYHKIPESCMYKGDVEEFIGVALDGFPIYGPRVSESQNVTESELDKCHGKVVNGSYRYYVTDKFPYYLGCFKGRVVNPNTMTQYNCSSNNTHWNLENYGYSYYLCHCVNSGTGSGGGGGGRPRPECAPENPNRPRDCPPCPREGCPSPKTSTPKTITGNMTGVQDGSSAAAHVVLEINVLVVFFQMTFLYLLPGDHS